MAKLNSMATTVTRTLVSPVVAATRDTSYTTHFVKIVVRDYHHRVVGLSLALAVVLLAFLGAIVWFINVHIPASERATRARIASALRGKQAVAGPGDGGGEDDDDDAGPWPGSGSDVEAAFPLQDRRRSAWHYQSYPHRPRTPTDSDSDESDTAMLPPVPPPVSASSSNRRPRLVIAV